MSRVFRPARTRGRWPGRAAGVLCALLPVLFTMPAVASACPKWSSVKAFRGSADTAFDETATGSDNNGGTVAVTLDRSGSVNIDLGGRVPKSGSSMTEFLGGTGGGILRVDDTYADTIAGAPTTGEQTADGPGVRDGLNNLAYLVLRPSKCTYQLDILFGVKTTSTGDWPPTPDEGAGGVAITPQRHIPSNLKLFGTADVPAYYDGCAGSEPHGGCYEFSGLAGGGYQWAQEFDMLKTCGSVVAATCAAEGQEGSATFSWSISPSPSPKKKKKKGHK